MEEHVVKQEIYTITKMVPPVIDASCLVVLENENKDSTNLSVFLMKIDKARFRKPITPGDQIRMEVKKEKSRGDVWQFYGESFVDDQLACEASFAAMVVRLDEAQND